MRLELEMELREAYYSADGDVPSVTWLGVGKGEGWEGPMHLTVRGVGLELGGMRIGKKYRVCVEESDEAVARGPDAADLGGPTKPYVVEAP